MNEPQSIDKILDRLQLQAIGRSEHLTNPMVYQLDIKEAKIAIEAMVREIVGESRNYRKYEPCPRCNGQYQYKCSCDDAEDQLLAEQRLRASKYNLKLEKE